MVYLWQAFVFLLHKLDDEDIKHVTNHYFKKAQIMYHQ